MADESYAADAGSAKITKLSKTKQDVDHAEQQRSTFLTAKFSNSASMTVAISKATAFIDAHGDAEIAAYLLKLTSLLRSFQTTFSQSDWAAPHGASFAQLCELIEHTLQQVNIDRLIEIISNVDEARPILLCNALSS